MNLIDMIPADELEKIDRYRKLYCDGGYSLNQKSAPIKDVLQVWSEAKKPLFETLFKDKLILEENIIFTQDSSNLRRPILDLINDPNSRALKFYLIEEIAKYNSQLTDWIINDICNDLFYTDSLTDNYYYGPDVSIFLPNNRTMKIQRGCKPMKLLQKLSKAFGKEAEAEAFRIKHSMLLNHKIIEGTLCLSIHPLDYMTMSDNDSNWHTCMAWTTGNEGGEYRQGTVEMMNSSCVIVAYLKSERGDFVWGDGEEDVWNNKKWRQLFIVDKDFVLGIKPYPYESEALTKAAQSKIIELLGWGNNVKLHEFSSREDVYCGRTVVNLTPVYGAMYNDFNRCEHWIGLNPEYKEAELKRDLVISGPSQCMCCGEVFSDWWAEKTLCCEKCLSAVMCSGCDCLLDPDCEDVYVHENGYYCAECYWEHFFEDGLDGKQKPCGKEYWIYLSCSNDTSEYHRPSYYTRSLLTSITRDKLDKWFKNTYLEHGLFEDTIFVTPNDLTNKGMEVFNFTTDERLDDWIRINS